MLKQEVAQLLFQGHSKQTRVGRREERKQGAAGVNEIINGVDKNPAVER